MPVTLLPAPLIVSVPLEPAAPPISLNWQLATVHTTLAPPVTDMLPVPQLPMSSPLLGDAPRRIVTIDPAPSMVTVPVPKPPKPAAICATFRFPPPETLRAPVKPVGVGPPVVPPSNRRVPVRSTGLLVAGIAGLASPVVETSGAALASGDSATRSAIVAPQDADRSAPHRGVSERLRDRWRMRSK